MAAIERALKKVDAPSAVIGGLAVIARGVPRFTEDIDATVVAANLDLPGMLAALRREKIVPRIGDWKDLVERAQILLLVHRPTGHRREPGVAALRGRGRTGGRAHSEPPAESLGCRAAPAPLA